MPHVSLITEPNLPVDENRSEGILLAEPSWIDRRGNTPLWR
jgi:hypothetical protein